MKLRLTHLGLCSLLALLMGVSPAAAELINFDSQAVMRGGNLTGIPDSPLMISTAAFISTTVVFTNTATFTGGELLNAEVGLNADQTGVYATEGLFGSGETNPLVIAFSAPVSNLVFLSPTAMIPGTTPFQTILAIRLQSRYHRPARSVQLLFRCLAME